MKRYNIISAGIGHKAVEADVGEYVLYSDCQLEIAGINSKLRALAISERDLKVINGELSSEVERHEQYCKWEPVTAGSPKSMNTDSDIPIRIGWDGSSGVIANATIGYCVHVGEGKIWLDCKGNDMNLAPDQQPTHWGPAMLPPGV